MFWLRDEEEEQEKCFLVGFKGLSLRQPSNEISVVVLYLFSSTPFVIVRRWGILCHYSWKILARFIVNYFLTDPMFRLVLIVMWHSKASHPSRNLLRYEWIHEKVVLMCIHVSAENQKVRNDPLKLNYSAIKQSANFITGYGEICVVCASDISRDIN